MNNIGNSRGVRRLMNNQAEEESMDFGKQSTSNNNSQDLANINLNQLPPDPAFPKFGAASTCGRRRDMEDTVAIHPSLWRAEENSSTCAADIHYFGVYDGHGCSHVAARCKEFMHKLVREEMHNLDWVEDMKRSFNRMDKEATKRTTSLSSNDNTNCRCKLEVPLFNAVGSAVIVTMLTPNKIIVSNCGDCRAVLCRGGRPFPLSVDHKPDRPDELRRIQAAGGRVISWCGARIEGVLAMSRAIGDTFLKPFVSCEPEVMILDRTDDDDCLILASDGLWDVVSNETACGIVKVCFRLEEGPRREVTVKEETYDRVCYKAAALLTTLAVARNSTDNISVVIVDLRKD